MNALSRAQQAYDAMEPEDDLTFLDVHEGLDWLDRSAEQLVAGQDVAWGDSLNPGGGVLHEELIEALEADHDYLEWRGRWLGLLLRNTDDDAADRDGLESDIRKLAYAKAKELLAPWADNYATWARAESETDTAIDQWEARHA